MIPNKLFTSDVWPGIPRESGDDPISGERDLWVGGYSPRERG